MKFLTAAEYRGLDHDELVARRDEIAEALNADDCDIKAMTEEVERCSAEFERRNVEASLRSQKITAIANGAGDPITRSVNTAEENNMTQVIEEDKFDSEGYKRAFFDYMVRGVQIPAEYRADATMLTTDVAPQIPTTMGKEIISKMEEYGTIWNKVRKLSVKGGLWFRTIDLNPTASWIDETGRSEYQKFTDSDQVSFSFYMLECRVAQSLLAAAVTFDDFQAMFTTAIAKAMVKALEQAIIRGTGTGQPKGITTDARVTNKVSMTATEVKDWKKWRSKVKKAIPMSYRNGEWIIAQSTWDAYIETMSDSQNSPVSIGYNPVTGVEEYRLMGNPVITVEDNVLPFFDDASTSAVFAIFGNLNDYAVNTQPGMPMTTKRWIDDETNKEKLKALVAVDGKVLDPNGFVLVTKGA